MASKKSQDARFQLHMWSRLLDGRIALQKVVAATRDLDEFNQDLSGEKSHQTAPAHGEATVKSVSKLLASIVRLRDTYRVKSQFNRGNETISETENAQIYSTVSDELLDARHDDYTNLRNSLIDKWYEKTKIGTIPKKGYTALELPTLQLITNALKDKERLVRRTQLDRTNPSNEAFHLETFNDDDFYHQLLKEVISKEEGRKWVELQRLRYKSKRKADTKASKGRKVKKDLIPKLVNFMAPTRPANYRGQAIPEQIRNELMKSLFGASVNQSLQTST